VLLRDGGQDIEREVVGVLVVSADEPHPDFHQGRGEGDVPHELTRLRDHQARTSRTGVTCRLTQHRAAALIGLGLNFGVLGNDLTVVKFDEPVGRDLLRFQVETRLALILGANSAIEEVLFHGGCSACRVSAPLDFTTTEGKPNCRASKSTSLLAHGMIPRDWGCRMKQGQLS